MLLLTFPELLSVLLLLSFFCWFLYFLDADPPAPVAVAAAPDAAVAAAPADAAPVVASLELPG